MRWFFRLFLASILAAVGFPKVLFTERVLPGFPTDSKYLVQDGKRTYTHNVKDDLTDFIVTDTEWWMKFYCFIAWSSFLLIALLLFLLILFLLIF